MASNTRIQGRGDYLFVVKVEPVTPQFEQLAFVAKVDRVIRRSPLALIEPGLSECYGATEEEAATVAGEAVEAWLSSHANTLNAPRPTTEQKPGIPTPSPSRDPGSQVREPRSGPDRRAAWDSKRR